MKLSILLCVTLIATLGAVSAKSSSTSVGQCSKQEEGVTYGVPSDCHQYIVCKKEKLQLKECESKYNYDTVTSQCVKAKTATCAVDEVPEEPQPAEPEPEEPQETDEQYDYLCVKVLYGVRIHPNTCDKYLVCSKEKAKIEYCDEGLIFVADAIQCVKGNKVTCSLEQDEPSTTQEPPTTTTTKAKEDESEESGESSEDSAESSKESEGQYNYLCEKKFLGVLAHPESCTKYITCLKYKAKEENCQKGYSYSSKLGLCVKQKNGECADVPQDPPTTTEAPTTVTTPSNTDSGESNSGESSKEPEGQYDYLCKNRFLGVLAHPESCTKYITCLKYKAKEENCQKGYSYSSKLGLCVKQNNGECADAPQDPPTTTEAPTTVTTPSNPDSGESNSGESSKEPEGQYDYLCKNRFLGVLAHPESCTKYITCLKYKAKEENCQKGYSYSSKLGLCVKQNNGECADAPQDPPTTTEAPTTVTTPTKPDSGESESGENSGSASGKYDYVCANVADGKQAHPDSCTKYITCKKQKAKEVNCKKGRYYSTYLQTCIKGNQETCAENNGNQGTSATPPPVTETTTTPPVSVTLGPSYPTDVELLTTDDSTTELTPPESGGDPMEPTVNCVEGFTGYLPIANDCTKYVYCFQGEPGQRSCLEEYIYYDPFKACLPGDPVLCQLYSI
uniref:Chitin-binding type-2 domain-containing protein n=1 Tax=Anopheles atroparvus TaxID=41427 RepID=A0A182JN57_ANOAO